MNLATRGLGEPVFPTSHRKWSLVTWERSLSVFPSTKVDVGQAFSSQKAVLVSYRGTFLQTLLRVTKCFFFFRASCLTEEITLLIQSCQNEQEIHILKPRGESPLFCFLKTSVARVFGCLAVGNRCHGELPGLVTLPMNSAYERANWGTHSNLTAGWRRGKGATFFFIF